MLLPSAYDKFKPFLDNSDQDLPRHERGLLPDAPLDAIEQYEDYKKIKLEAIENGIDV